MNCPCTCILYLQVTVADQEYTEWLNQVKESRSKHKWLLFLTANKVIRLFGLLEKKDIRGITQEIGYLFKNSPAVRQLLCDNIEVCQL